ncbi:hypothetical protein [Mucilaginibacter ginsenosidivorax]|uniref:Uncharacterized protein n=1 Tax=Mucilaginibacter ginsenosidivorax TaxID=862126 RepID=A0A5B8W7X5_9SPHI|nr:hypothetical protein [Mucilaginibacter ginsenosidivorax]QEC79075.1 hypothetical protein FSB76_25135 [Mucilaginibacter ginsenosidivorax]
MHIAYSALNQPNTPTLLSQKFTVDGNNDLPEPLLRYQAYLAACQKLSKEITAIQKHSPGWMPVFR